MNTIKSAVMLSIGIAAGWLLASYSNDAGRKFSSQPEMLIQGTTRVREHTLIGRPNHSRLLGLSEDPSRLESELASLDGKSLATIISMISANVSVLGITPEESLMIDSLLSRMYELDSEATISWIVALPNTTNRKVFFRSILEIESEQDPLQALRFAERFRQMTGDVILLPHTFADAMVEHGTGALLRALALVSDDEFAHLPTSYPEGFDFRSVVEGMASQATGRDEGEFLVIGNIEFWHNRGFSG